MPPPTSDPRNDAVDNYDDGTGNGGPQDLSHRLGNTTVQRLRGIVRRHLIADARGKIGESDIVQDVLMSLLLPRNLPLLALPQEQFERQLNHHALWHTTKANRFFTQARAMFGGTLRRPAQVGSRRSHEICPLRTRHPSRTSGIY